MKNLRATPCFSVLICSLVFSVQFATLAQSSSPYAVTGNLIDETGRAVSGITVCAIPAEGGVLRVRDKTCAETGAQGEFVINLTQPGKYQVTREKKSEGYMPSYEPFYRDPRIPIPEVTVGDHTPRASVSLALGKKSGLITGKVIDEAADKPIQDFVVWVWQQRDRNARYHEVVKGTNSIGRFKLFAPAVPFQLRVAADGYEDWVMSGGALVSAGGPRSAPGSLLVPAGSTADFAVYMKRKNPASGEPALIANDKRLPAPSQTTPADNAVLDNFPRITKLEWAPVPEAVSYGVEVEACWKPSPPAHSQLPDDGQCINPSPHLEKLGLVETTVEFMFRGAQPGRWRVWAIDRDHRPGLKSPWRSFVHLR